jgi:hypothetical protein
VPRRFLLACCVIALVVAGCKVETTVEVTVRENGSGVVRVIVTADAEAVEAVESGGTPIDQAVRLTDLEDAGFRVGSWEKAEDGSATAVISRSFRSVSEVAGIVAALNGEEGPLPELRATRERGLVATEYGVQGRIDLGAVTTGVADDAELLARLQALGIDVTTLDAQLLAQVQSSFALKVVVKLPDQPPRTFTPKEGTTTASVDASAQILDTERIAFIGAAIGFLLLATVVWIRGGRRRRRRRASTRGSGRRQPVADTATDSATDSASTPRRPPPRGGRPSTAQPPVRPPERRPGGLDPRGPGGPPRRPPQGPSRPPQGPSGRRPPQPPGPGGGPPRRPPPAR